MPTTYTITRQNDASYDFTINLDAAFATATTIRWEIVPVAGKFPSASFSGTVDFNTSQTTQTVPTGITRNHIFPRDFEIRLYNDGTNALPHTSDAQSVAGDATLAGTERLDGGGGDDKNIIGLGASEALVANGLRKDDAYIITRYQYGNVEISDTFGDANLIKFDYGVTITAVSESASIVFGNISYGSITLTLSTGAEVEITSPAGRFSYQIGDGEVMNYLDFKAAIKVVHNTDNPAIPPVASLPQEFTVSSSRFDITGDALDGDVDENVGDADALFTFKAVLKSDANADVSYDITGGNTGGVFEVVKLNDGSGNAVISLASGKNLDYEDDSIPNSYTLTVQLSAMAAGATEAETQNVTVTISVRDINDEVPVLADVDGIRTATITENAAGADAGDIRFTVTDADAGTIFTANSFTISHGTGTSQDTAEKFRVVQDGNNWDLMLKSGISLDYETDGTSGTINLNVRVSDGDNDSVEVIPITISVTDINDESPKATPAGTGTVRIVTAADNPVGGDGIATGYTITVTDADATNTINVSVSGDADDRFEFKETSAGSGVWALFLKAGKAITEAEGSTISLTYRVTDGGVGTTPASDSFTIAVTGAVAASITFSFTDGASATLDPADVEVPENQNTDTFLTISASVAAAPSAHTITYDFAPDGNPDDTFAITSDGNISLASGKVLDYETTPNSYTLTIRATYDADGDSNTTGDQQTKDVEITVNVFEVAIELSADSVDRNERYVGSLGIDVTVTGHGTYQDDDFTILDAEGNVDTRFDVVWDESLQTGTLRAVEAIDYESFDEADRAGLAPVPIALTIQVAGVNAPATFTYNVMNLDDVAPKMGFAQGTGAITGNTAGADSGISFVVSDADTPISTTGRTTDTTDIDPDSFTIAAQAIDLENDDAALQAAKTASADFTGDFELVRDGTTNNWKLKLKPGTSIDHADTALPADNILRFAIHVTDPAGKSSVVRNADISVEDATLWPVLGAPQGTGEIIENADGADTGITFTLTDSDTPISTTRTTDTTDIDPDSFSIAAQTIEQGDDAALQAAKTASADFAGNFEFAYDDTAANWKLKLKPGVSIDYENTALPADKILRFAIHVTDAADNDSEIRNVQIAVDNLDEESPFLSNRQGGTGDPTRGSIQENALGADTRISYMASDEISPGVSRTIQSDDFIITVQNPSGTNRQIADRFELVRDGTSNNWKLKLKDGISLDYEGDGDGVDGSGLVHLAIQLRDPAGNLSLRREVNVQVQDIANEVTPTLNFRLAIFADVKEGLVGVNPTVNGRADPNLRFELTDPDTTISSTITAATTDIDPGPGSFMFTARDGTHADFADFFEVVRESDTSNWWRVKLKDGMKLDYDDARLESDKLLHISLQVTDPDGNRSTRWDFNVAVQEAQAPVLTQHGTARFMENVDNLDTGITFTLTDADTAISFTATDDPNDIDPNNIALTVRDGTHTKFIDHFIIVRLGNSANEWKLKLKGDAAINFEDDDLDADGILHFAVQVTDPAGKVSNIEEIDISVENIDEGAAEFKAVIAGAADSASPQSGETLTFDTDPTKADPDGNPSDFGFQWFRYTDADTTPQYISGATGGSYQITTADAGFRLGVGTTYQDGGGFSSEVRTILHFIVDEASLSGTADQYDPSNVDASGTFAYTGDAPTAAIAAGATYAIKTQSTLGVAKIDANTGSWTFNVDNTNDAIKALAADATTTASFTVAVTLADGITKIDKDVTITITGQTATQQQGTPAADTLNRTAFSDFEVIQGSDARDTINVGSGGAVVFGGYGDDTINLGDGADAVVHRFSARDGGASWRLDDGGDTINNFEIGKDSLIFVDTDGTTLDLASFLQNGGDGLSGDRKVSVYLGFGGTDDAPTITSMRFHFLSASDANGPANGADADRTGRELTINFKTAIDFSANAQALSGISTPSAGDTGAIGTDGKLNDWQYLPNYFDLDGSVDHFNAFGIDDLLIDILEDPTQTPLTDAPSTIPDPTSVPRIHFRYNGFFPDGHTGNFAWAHVPNGKFPVPVTNAYFVQGQYFENININDSLDLGAVNYEFARNYQVKMAVWGLSVNAFFFGAKGTSTTTGAVAGIGAFTSAAVVLPDGDAGNNVIGLGYSGDIAKVDGGAGDDTFIITRYQYGDATIDDDTFSVGNKNLIKFDADVRIDGFLETADAVALTLSTGAVITIQNPDNNFDYQLGNSADALAYAAFKTEIGATAPNSLAAQKYIGTPTATPTAPANTADAPVTELYGGDSDEIFTMAGDAPLYIDGAGGDDIYVITRHQTGDVTINDGGGDANLIKLDHGVVITGYHETTDYFGVSSLALTLYSGAVITINRPSVGYMWQFGDNALINVADNVIHHTRIDLVNLYNAFKGHIGATETNKQVSILHIINHWDNTSPLNALDNAVYAFNNNTYTGPVSEDAAVGTAVVTVTITDKTQPLNFVLSGAGSQFFTAATNVDGNLTISRNDTAGLDSDTLEPRHYILTLTTTAAGSFLTATSTIRINVNDINDSTPTITESADTADVLANILGAETGISFAIEDADTDESNDFTGIVTARGTTTAAVAAWFEVVEDTSVAGGRTYKLKLKDEAEIDFAQVTGGSIELSVKVNDGRPTTGDSNVVEITLTAINFWDDVWAVGSAAAAEIANVGNARKVSEYYSDGIATPIGVAANTKLADLIIASVNAAEWTFSIKDGGPTNVAGAEIFAIDANGALSLAAALDYNDPGVGFIDAANTIKGYTLTVVATNIAEPTTIYENDITIQIENVFMVDTASLSGTAKQNDPYADDATGTITYTAESRGSASEAEGATYAIKTPSAHGLARIDNNGRWTFGVDNENSAVKNLAAGATLTTSFTVEVTLADGTKIDLGAISITITGQAAKPTQIPGTAGAETLNRASSSDFEIIQGGAGDDTITVGSGGALVIGGYGKDTITLGAGADVVAHRFASATRANEDTAWRLDDGGDIIKNFEVGVDSLILLDTDETAVNLADFLNEDISGPSGFFGQNIYGESQSEGQVAVRIMFADIHTAAPMITGIQFIFHGTEETARADRTLTIEFKTPFAFVGNEAKLSGRYDPTETATVSADPPQYTPAPQNDNAPVFNIGSRYSNPNAYEFELLENAPIGAELITIQATDADPGTTLTYDIVGGNPDITVNGSTRKLFVIDKNSGVIKLNGLLDFSTTSGYALTARAYDGDPNDANTKTADIGVTIRIREHKGYEGDTGYIQGDGILGDYALLPHYFDLTDGDSEHFNVIDLEGFGYDIL